MDTPIYVILFVMAVVPWGLIGVAISTDFGIAGLAVQGVGLVGLILCVGPLLWRRS